MAVFSNIFSLSIVESQEDVFKLNAKKVRVNFKEYYNEV